MNNVQSNSSVNIKSSNTLPYTQTQTTDIKKQSPEKLKEKIESGEVNESDFANKEEFDKFVAFLSKLLGEDIKIYAKSEAITKVETEISKKDNILNESSVKVKANADETVKANNVNINHTKLVENETIKEGITNPSAKQLIQNPSLPVNTNTQVQHTEVALFKADNVDKSAMVKEQSIQITDKTVVLHTLGGNNLSISGNEVGAQGDTAFLEQTRTFASDEGFHENNNQHQSEDEDNSDIDKIYFTKDSEQ